VTKAVYSTVGVAVTFYKFVLWEVAGFNCVWNTTCPGQFFVVFASPPGKYWYSTSVI